MSSAAPSLRLFGAKSFEAGSPPSPDWTLTQLHEHFVVPRSVETSDQTIKLRREALNYWSQATTDPPLGRITEETTALFARFLKTLPGQQPGTPMAKNTRNKHCRTIQRLLNLAGPKTPSTKLAAGVLDKIPFIDAPPIVKRKVRDLFTQAEVDAIIEACVHVRTRRNHRFRQWGIQPWQWWQGVFGFDWYLGLRIGSLLKLEWSWIFFDDEGRRKIRIQGEDMKGEREDEECYIPDPAWAFIAPLQGKHPTLIFPWPYHPCHLHQIRRQIIETAGLPPHRRFGFHGVRKRFASNMGRINPLAAQMALGHAAGSDVTLEHYTAEEVMIETQNALPQCRRPGKGDNQLRMF